MVKKLIGNREKAAIHVAKAKLGLDDDTYREILSRLGGVASSRDLDIRGFEKVMAHFESCGFDRKSRKPAGARTRTAKPVPEKRPLLSKIDALLTVQNLPRSYADAIARQMFKVEKLEWCAPGQLHAVAVALIKRGQKQKAREAEDVQGGKDRNG